MAAAVPDEMRVTQLAADLFAGRLFVGNLGAVFDDDFMFGEKVPL
jgi:hypothetical protein